MTATPRDKYARVYHGIARDPKFDTVFPDDRQLATWLRLLLVADASWPSYPPIPRTVRKASLDALVAVGLVDLLPGDCYRIHGLDKERTARAEQASNAAAKRWHSARNAHTVLPNQTIANQTRPEQTARAPEGWDEPEGEALTWLAQHGCYVKPGNGYHQQLVTAVEHHGVTAIVGWFDRLARAGVKDGDTKGFIFGAIDGLNPKVDIRALEREDEERKRHRAELERTRRLIEEGRRAAS